MSAKCIQFSDVSLLSYRKIFMFYKEQFYYQKRTNFRFSLKNKTLQQMICLQKSVNNLFLIV